MTKYLILLLSLITLQSYGMGPEESLTDKKNKLTKSDQYDMSLIQLLKDMTVSPNEIATDNQSEQLQEKTAQLKEALDRNDVNAVRAIMQNPELNFPTTDSTRNRPRKSYTEGGNSLQASINEAKAKYLKAVANSDIPAILEALKSPHLGHIRKAAEDFITLTNEQRVARQLRQTLQK